MNEIEAYLRKAAALRGMDPDAVVRVAKTEGGLSDPFQQSHARRPDGSRERSYGPLQLYIDGGLGNEAMKAGIDPRKDWMGGIDFGLDAAARDGSWKQWYGPQNAGLPLDYGLKGAKPAGITLNSRMSMMADGPKGQEAYPRMAPPLSPPRTIADRPIGDPSGGMTTDPGSFDGLKDMLAKMDGGASGEGGGFASLMSAFGGGESAPAAPQIQPSNLGPSVSNEIAAKATSAQQMMQALLASKRPKGRVPGISLMG